jgi:hypothetical protein
VYLYIMHACMHACAYKASVRPEGIIERCQIHFGIRVLVGDKTPSSQWRTKVLVQQKQVGGEKLVQSIIILSVNKK